MPTKPKLPQTFPHRVIFVASMTLCFCAVAGIIVAVISWNNRAWGYYFGTGFWSGGVVLLAGIFGIVASFVRNAGSVKLFMIFTIFGFVVSLAMVALSCGGLDPDSGFYNDVPDGSLVNTICHGAYLGLGVLQLAICILADAVSFYYLFVENHAEIYSVKLRGKKKPLRRNRPKSKDKTRASTSSSVPLMGGSTRSRPGSRSSKKRKSGEENTVEQDDTDMPIKRNRGSFVKAQNGLDFSTPIRTPCVRPPSFTTFGRSDIASERASLIVHPDDNASVPDTNRSQASDLEFSAYAATPLFEPPLPIEEDEELPPYQYTDNSSYANVVMRINTRECPDSELAANGYQIRRANSAPLHSMKSAQKRRREFKRSSQGKLVAVPGREPAQAHSTENTAAGDFAKYIIDRPDLSTRRSHSAERLHDGHVAMETARHPAGGHIQGVQRRDFSKSSDRIVEPAVIMRDHRSQSVTRVNRDTRLDRRRRALSVELKPSKQQRLDNDFDLQRRGHSTHDSTSALYAGTKIQASKFSLRTRLSQKGPRSAVPVKSLSSLPLFSPPAKPPRTHSVTLDDFDGLPDKVTENPYESLEDVKKKMPAVDNVPSTSNKTNIFYAKTDDEDLPQKRNYILNSDVGRKDSAKKVKPNTDAIQSTVDASAFAREISNEVKQRALLKNNTVENETKGTRPPIKQAPPITENTVKQKHIHKETPLPVAPNTDVHQKQYVHPVGQDNKVKQQNIQKQVSLQVAPSTNVRQEKETYVHPVGKKETEQTIDDDVFISPQTATVDLGLQSPKQKEKTSGTTIDSGPVVKLTLPPVQTQKPITKNNNVTVNTAAVPERSASSETSRALSRDSSMVLPLSPVIKPPPVIAKDVKQNDTLSANMPEPIYSKINKDSQETKPMAMAPQPKPKPRTRRLSSDVSNIAPVSETNKNSNNISESRPPVTTSEKEDISGVEYRVRPSPLSPSERILQRKNERPITTTQVVGAPTKTERRSVEAGRNLFLSSTEYQGARPKTSPKRTLSEDPDERPIRPFVHDDPKNAAYGPKNRPVSFTQLPSPSTASPLPQPFNSRPKFSFVYPSQATTKKPVSPTSPSAIVTLPGVRRTDNSAQGIQTFSKPVQPSPSIQRTDGKNSNEIARATTNNIPPQSGASTKSEDSGNLRNSGSAPSQGVLHLPQSQYPRQVADTNRDAAPPIDGAVGNGEPASPPPPPLLQLNNDQDGEKPLFSVVL